MTGPGMVMWSNLGKSGASRHSSGASRELETKKFSFLIDYAWRSRCQWEVLAAILCAGESQPPSDVEGGSEESQRKACSIVPCWTNQASLEPGLFMNIFFIWTNFELGFLLSARFLSEIQIEAVNRSVRLFYLVLFPPPLPSSEIKIRWCPFWCVLHENNEIGHGKIKHRNQGYLSF